MKATHSVAWGEVEDGVLDEYYAAMFDEDEEIVGQTWKHRTAEDAIAKARDLAEVNHLNGLFIETG